MLRHDVWYATERTFVGTAGFSSRDFIPLRRRSGLPEVVSDVYSWILTTLYKGIKEHYKCDKRPMYSDGQYLCMDNGK